MPAVELQAAPSTHASAVGARLVVPRHEALRVLKSQLDRGLEIKRSRIRYVPELERAREAKGQWTSVTMEVLRQMFNTHAVADECQNWVGKVLPEYADLNLFIEHFYDEMDQRLRKLHAVYKRVQELPDETAKSVGSAAAVAAAASANAAAAAAQPPGNNMSNKNPDFFEAPAPAAVAAPPRHSGSSPGRKKAGAIIVYERDQRAQASIREFCTKLGFELIEVAGGDDPRSLTEQLDAREELDFGLILSRGDHPPRPFELGYCVGRLGHKRVFVLSPSDDKLTADEHGLLHIPLDPADGWQLHLARQFKRAGLEVDLNRVF
jgi:predicted nucleotide-binding protein